MMWNEIQKDWQVLSSKFKTKWVKLTDVDLKAIAGKRDELVKRLVDHYKTDKKKLETEVEDFVKGLKVSNA